MATSLQECFFSRLGVGKRLLKSSKSISDRDILELGLLSADRQYNPLPEISLLTPASQEPGDDAPIPSKPHLPKPEA